jgi:hypothetical protein
MDDFAKKMGSHLERWLKRVRFLEGRLIEIDKKLAASYPRKQDREKIYNEASYLVISEAEDAQGRIWQKARTVLMKANRPMSVPEIAEALVQLGLSQMSEAIGKETLRSSIKRKPEIFARVGGGKVTLRRQGLKLEEKQIDKKLAEAFPLLRDREEIYGELHHLLREEIVTEIRSFLGELPSSLYTISGPEKSEVPIWQKVRDVLMKQNRPMSVPEIAEALVELGLFQMSLAIGKETLRSSIARKPEIFAYVGGRKVTLRRKGPLAEAE